MERLATSLEGNRQKLDGGAMFGNAPRALWTRWATPDSDNRIDLACRALLVREPDGRRVLCETGIGAFFPPDLRARYGVVEAHHVLLDALAEVGCTDADIDVVVLSHLHFDHAGGLLAAWSPDSKARLLFPNAQFIVHAAAWERARAPHVRDRASYIPELVALLEASGRLHLVGHTPSATLFTPLLPDWRFHVSYGHTPGLLLAEVPFNGGPVVFGADLVPGRAWMHAPITMGYDRAPELLVDEKSQLLGDLVARGGSLFFTHDPEVALARVTQDANGRFLPTSPRATLRDLAL
jgi:glyoxylase-like metal-dependent hydrolase (beta-lactamase superfamily II)